MVPITFLFFKDLQCVNCDTYHKDIIDDILHNEDVKKNIIFEYKPIGFDETNLDAQFRNGKYIPFVVRQRYYDVGITSTPAFIMADSNELTEDKENNEVPLTRGKYFIYVPNDIQNINTLTMDQKKAHFINWFFDAYTKLLKITSQQPQSLSSSQFQQSQQPSSSFLQPRMSSSSSSFQQPQSSSSSFLQQQFQQPQSSSSSFLQPRMSITASTPFFSSTSSMGSLSSQSNSQINAFTNRNSLTTNNSGNLTTSQSQNNGLLDESKPTFVFMKKPNCSPCKTFDNDVWPQFLADPELNQMVNLKKVIMISEGGVNKSFDAYQYEGVPTHFPYFVLVKDTKLVNNGTKFGGQENLFFRFNNKTISSSLSNIKDWIRSVYPNTSMQSSNSVLAGNVSSSSSSSSNMQNKPTIVFMKKTGCPPCMQFYGDPAYGKETGENWKQIIENPDLTSKYNFELVVYPFQNEKDEKKYGHLVEYFPFFFRVGTDQINNDKPVVPDEVLQAPRDVEGFTNFLLKNYNKWYPNM
jgi:hypothetical protein